VSSVDREAPEAPIDNVIDQHQLQPLFDDEIDELIKGMFDVEPVLDQQHVNGYVDFPQVCDLPGVFFFLNSYKFSYAFIPFWLLRNLNQYYVWALVVVVFLV